MLISSNVVNTVAAPALLRATAAAADAPSRAMPPSAAQPAAMPAPVLQESAQKTQTGAGDGQAVPSFITPASLVTVSGGTTAVTILWQVSKLLMGQSAQSPWVPFVFSLLVGTVIYLVSIQDKNVQATTQEKIVGMFIGFVNSMVLFAAAVGILGR